MKSIRLDGQVGLLQQMQTDGQARLLIARSMTMEWLGIGVAHSMTWVLAPTRRSQRNRPLPEEGVSMM